MEKPWGGNREKRGLLCKVEAVVPAPVREAREAGFRRVHRAEALAVMANRLAEHLLEDQEVAPVVRQAVAVLVQVMVQQDIQGDIPGWSVESRSACQQLAVLQDG